LPFKSDEQRKAAFANMNYDQPRKGLIAKNIRKSRVKKVLKAKKPMETTAKRPNKKATPRRSVSSFDDIIDITLKKYDPEPMFDRDFMRYYDSRKKEDLHLTDFKEIPLNKKKKEWHFVLDYESHFDENNSPDDLIDFVEIRGSSYAGKEEVSRMGFDIQNLAAVSVKEKVDRHDSLDLEFRIWVNKDEKDEISDKLEKVLKNHFPNKKNTYTRKLDNKKWEPKKNLLNKEIKKYYKTLPKDWKKAETKELLDYLQKNTKGMTRKEIYQEISKNNLEYGILFNLGIGTDIINSKKAMIEINYKKAEELR
jgi:hypothetical protein